MFATARCFQVLAAAVIMAISVTPMAEARHWRYHGYFGYYGYYGQDRGVGQDRSRELSPGWSRNDPSIGQLKSFGSSIEQMIRSCEKQSVELKKTPFDSVSRTIRPNADQRAALDQIQHAAFESADTLAATCPQGVPPGLNEKFDTLINAINAMAVSRSTLHPAMVNFYSLLDEEQRARLVVHSLPNDQTNFDRNSRGNTNDEGDAKQDSICREWATILRSWPTRQIETGVSLSDAQRAALYDVTAQMYRAAGALIASCPAETPLTPVGRFEYDQRQLEALHQSVDGLQPVITRFDNLLNDTQKARTHAIINGSQEPMTTGRYSPTTARYQQPEHREVRNRHLWSR